MINASFGKLFTLLGEMENLCILGQETYSLNCVTPQPMTLFDFIVSVIESRLR